MGTEKLFYKKYRLETEESEELLIVVDIQRVPSKNHALVNQKLLVSLLAKVLVPPKSNKKILVNVHNNKEIHVHVDKDKKGKPIGLDNIDEILSYFERKVNSHFNFKKEFKI